MLYILLLQSSVYAAQNVYTQVTMGWYKFNNKKDLPWILSELRIVFPSDAGNVAFFMKKASHFP
jgi:hypothetical protein